jgi:hypothetical protein
LGDSIGVVRVVDLDRCPTPTEDLVAGAEHEPVRKGQPSKTPAFPKGHQLQVEVLIEFV